MGAVLTFCAIEPAKAISLTFQPTDQEVVLGSQAVFNVAISGLGGGVPPSLGTFDFDVRFDPGILAFASITFGDPVLGDQLGPVSGSITGFSSDPISGLVNQFEVSLELLPSTLDALQPDSFILTTLSFNTLGIGSGSFDIMNVLLGDSQGDQLFADTIENGSVNVRSGSAIPDSGNGVCLLGIAVAALCSARSLQQSWKPLKL